MERDETMNDDTINAIRAELAATRCELQAVRLKLTLCRRELSAARAVLATVAHEINNPLAYIQSNLGSLSRYADKLARYAGAVRAAEPQLQGADDPAAQRLGRRLQELRRLLKLDFVLEDLEPLVQQSLRGTARVQGVVQALQETAAGDRLDPAAGRTRSPSRPNAAPDGPGRGDPA